MKKKERWWKWLNILYFGGGIVLAFVGIIVLKISLKMAPISAFGSCLFIYFVVLGVPFILITNKWLLRNHNQDG